MSAKSLRARLKEAQEQARILQHRLDSAKAARSPAAEARERQAAQAHKDGTKLPVRQGKSSARAHVLFAGQAPGDTAMTNIPVMTRVRVRFDK